MKFFTKRKLARPSILPLVLMFILDMDLWETVLNLGIGNRGCGLVPIDENSRLMPLLFPVRAICIDSRNIMQFLDC